jgi:hypothetical protein
MSFASEHEMALPVLNWLRRECLLTKSEFALPWGICDVVGLSFNASQLVKRLSFGQRGAIGPLRRVQLLMQIPERESGKGISLHRLGQLCGNDFDKPTIEEEVQKLISGRFVVQSHNGHLQKLNGWAPLQDRIVAIELKLSRISEVLSQARCHRTFATESYIAMPSEIAVRIAAGARSSQFRSAGVGIVSVMRSTCRVILPCFDRGCDINQALQMHCVERFWRTRDSSS